LEIQTHTQTHAQSHTHTHHSLGSQHTLEDIHTHTHTHTRLNISAKKPGIPVKEPHIPATEPHISAKEPYIPAKKLSLSTDSLLPSVAPAYGNITSHAMTKESYISAKEPYIPANELSPSTDSHLHLVAAVYGAIHPGGGREVGNERKKGVGWDGGGEGGGVKRMRGDGEREERNVRLVPALVLRSVCQKSPIFP